jgi:hypothetical protein
VTVSLFSRGCCSNACVPRDADDCVLHAALRSVLLENVEEKLDGAIEPVLTRQTFRKGGQLLLRLNE